MRNVNTFLATLIACLGLALSAAHAASDNEGLAQAATTLIVQGQRVIDTYDAANGIDTSDKFSDFYFDVFEAEGLEADIGLRDAARKADLESRFSQVISLTAQGADKADVAAAWQSLRQGLEEERQHYGAAPVEVGGWWASFVQAFLILLREGVEALLVVGALIAYVKRTGTDAQMRGLYSGIGLALVASAITAWAVRESILGLDGRSLEAVEGVTMLIAAAVLLYVGHWLFSKRESERWQGYIKEKVDRAVASGSGFALSFAAFLAVYREGAETVLFYQALLADRPDGIDAIAAGFAVAALALTLIFFAIRTLGLRLPLKLFFTATAILLVVLSFIFVGKGVVELQVIRWIAATPFEGVPQIGWLGIFPTRESLLAQLLLLAIIAVGTLIPLKRKAHA